LDILTPHTTDKDLLHSVIPIINKLKTINHDPLKIEPSLDTLDFYVLNRKQGYSQRLRYYFQNGLLYSSRIIVADIQNRAPITWSYQKKTILARSEYIYVIRHDVTPNSARVSYDNNTSHFFTSHDSVYAVVYKNIIRGNFGRIWDHRDAVYVDRRGSVIDATKQKSVIGMGPYINFLLQRVSKFIPETKVPTKDVLPLVAHLISGSLSPKTLFTQLSSSDYIQQYRIELECKDKKYHQDGAYICSQLEYNLAKAHIPFAVASSRKIS
jgi:hypothetical protein